MRVVDAAGERFPGNGNRDFWVHSMEVPLGLTHSLCGADLVTDRKCDSCALL